MKNPPLRAPIGFSITNPARIALDFGATANATGRSAQDIHLGDVRAINLVQAGERTRLVLNLKRPLNYATAVDGIGRGALLVWALDEVVRGASPFRRTLGAVILAAQLAMLVLG